MGIIQKQAVRTNTVIFIGLGLGMIARLSLPFILSKEQIGILSIVDAVSLLLATIFTLGFVQVSYRMLPKFRDAENGHNGFVSLGLIFSLTGAALAYLAFFIFRERLFGESSNIEPLYSISFLALPIIFFRILFKNSDVIFRMLGRSVIGAFLESFLLKAFFLLLLVSFWLELLSFNSLMAVYAAILILPGLVLFTLMIKTKGAFRKPSDKLLKGEGLRELLRNATFGLLISAGGILVLSIDQIMLANSLSMSEVGVYSVLFFAGSVVAIPSKGIKRIATSALGESFLKNNPEDIKNTYQKSALVGQVSGGYLLVVGWACLHEVLHFIPDYAYAVNVFLFIGLGQLVEMSTGVNQEIVATSAKYHLNMYAMLILGTSVVLSNYLLIPIYGIEGAAIASLISFVVVNLYRFSIGIVHFGLQPYTNRSAMSLVMIASFLLVGFFRPLSFSPIINALVYFVLITSTYWLLVFRLNLSSDINEWLKKLWNTFAKKATP